MNLFQRYIFSRAFKLTVTTLVAATVIVLITQVLDRVNLLTSSGQALVTFAKLALLLVPSVAALTLPFAMLFGVIQVMSRMNSDSELAVLESAGASPIATSLPIFLLGLLLSAVTFTSNNFVEPTVNRELRNLVSTAGADLVRTAIQSGSFKQLDENLYIQVAEEKPGGKLGGLFIADLRDANMDLLYYAKEATIMSRGESSLLAMEDGQIQRKARSTGDVSIIRFDSYSIDFSQFGAAGKDVIYFPKEQSLAYLLNPPATDYFAKNRPHQIRSEIHRRFTEWMYPLAFAAIASYFVGAARSNRQEQIWSVAAASLIALTLRGGGFFTTNLAGTSSAFAVLVYAAPAGVFAIFTWLTLTGRQLRVPQRLVDGASAAAAWIEQRRIALQLWLQGYRGDQAKGPT